MAPDRWQRVQEVLAAAIECGIGEREQLLADRCAGDVELRREVETLLAAHDEPGPIDGLVDAIAPASSWVRAQAIRWEGRRVGRYLVIDLLGAGGMGLVYKARDERLGRHVALKFLPPHLCTQPAAKQRFLVEARAAAALDHANVCTIHEIGETEDGQLFIAMPLYEGETLERRLTRGRLSFEEAAPIAIQVAQGLGHAHEHGIVHRDLKPSNVMLLTDGSVKILDFGIAKMDDQSLTGDGLALGTIAYMSPERVRGAPVDHRADIWSLGVLLHEMLSGRRPFCGDDRQAVADAILGQDPDLIATAHPDVPSGIDEVLGKAIAALPERRYASMAPFAADLAALASGEAHPSHDHKALPIGERRHAVVLVTTVSDYGAIVEHLAAEDAQRVVAQIRDVAVEVVRRHGGLVNQAIGEEIVSLFGVPTSHEDDELRAVRAALELHARVRELPPGTGWSGTVRVQSGLHVGSVVAQRFNDGPRRYAVVGAPAQVASRLAAIAAPGDVVLSPECHHVVAPFVRTASCVPMVLEPGAGPVTPVRVTGDTGLETRLEASERSGLTPYIGRQSELALLESYVRGAGTREGRVVTVVGEPGVGKSRLLHELRESIAAARGVRLLQGRCRAYGDAAPYFPFVEILREALDVRAGLDSRDTVARIRAIDASLEPFIPLHLHLLSVPTESHPLPHHLPGENLQAALLDALAAVFAVLSRDTTLVVLLEDWHWADAASCAALRRMAEIVATHTLVFIVTTRPERGAMGEWPAHGTRIQLDPLDFATSTAIMQASLRVERVSDELARRVYERTGGNPFFLEQVCSALLERGVVAARDGEAVVEGGPRALSLPDTVQAVIRTRLDNLEPRSREVLRVAAVIGRDFEHALLADVLEPEWDLAPAIARLKASGLIQQTSVVPEVAYRFKHVLTQEVSYESLLEHQRKSLHGVLGRAIEAHDADRLGEKAAVLVHHFERAGAWPEAVRYGQRAAERASALSQFGDALATLDRVLEWVARLPEDEARRDLEADVLLQQERECETLGLRRRQQEIIGRLIALLAPLGPSARLAQTYLREGNLLTLLKRFNDAGRALNMALRISTDERDVNLERCALRGIGLLGWHEGRHADALAIMEKALVIDRACGDDLAVAGDLTNLGIILKGMGEYQRARAALEEALAMPSLAQHPKKMGYALQGLANVHHCLGDLDQALACLRRADEISQALLLPIERSFHLTSIAHIELQQGHLDAAIHTYREAIELSRRARHAEGLAQSLRTLGEVLFGLGKHDDALPCLREAAGLFAQLEDRESEAGMWSRVATALESGSPAEAAETWRVVCDLRKQLVDPRGELEALEGIARATRQAAPSPHDSIPQFEAALRLAATLGEMERELSLRNTLGILEWERGGYVQALQHYEAALLLARGLRDRVHEGLILNGLGVTLNRLDRPEEARTALEESVAVNRETNQRLLEAHAMAALGQVCLTVHRPDQATQWLEQSLELRRQLRDRAGEGWMRLRLAEARTAMGDTTAARESAAAAAILAVELGDAKLAHACAPYMSPTVGESDQE